MELRDYNRRCADALKAVLAWSSASVIPSPAGEVVESKLPYFSAVDFLSGTATAALDRAQAAEAKVTDCEQVITYERARNARLETHNAALKADLERIDGDFVGLYMGDTECFKQLDHEGQVALLRDIAANVGIDLARSARLVALLERALDVLDHNRGWPVVRELINAITAELK